MERFVDLLAALVHCPPPPGGVTVTWPMNNKKSMGNHRRRRKILVGYTRVQVTVVWWRGTAIPRGGGVGGWT